jgi:hypothetical protein
MHALLLRTSPWDMQTYVRFCCYLPHRANFTHLACRQSLSCKSNSQRLVLQWINLKRALIPYNLLVLMSYLDFHWALHIERLAASSIVANEVLSLLGTSLATMPLAASLLPYIRSHEDISKMYILHLELQGPWKTIIFYMFSAG